jgi:hypothetical protein
VASSQRTAPVAPGDRILTKAAASLRERPRTARSAVIPKPAEHRAGLGAGMSMAQLPPFQGQDIRNVPLGEILDYARRLPYDEVRGHELTLGPNANGQTAHVKIWPEAGTSSMETRTLRKGWIVARIESSGAYDDYGLANGLNYLWVEGAPTGYRGVIVPATAFAPLHELPQLFISEDTPPGVPADKAAYWLDGRLWLACGDC